MHGRQLSFFLVDSLASQTSLLSVLVRLIGERVEEGKALTWF